MVWLLWVSFGCFLTATILTVSRLLLGSDYIPSLAATEWIHLVGGVVGLFITVSELVRIGAF